MSTEEEIRELGQHRAWFKTSPEYLAKLLHLPDTAQIVGVQMDSGEWPLSLKIIVTDPGLPSVDEGELAPEVTPSIEYHAERWDFDWGVDDGR